MPMNDTTQANATAKTALGCLNGLAAEPWTVPLIQSVSVSGCASTRGFRSRVAVLVRSGPQRVVLALGVGQRVERRQRGGQRGLLVRAELGQQSRRHAPPVRPGGARASPGPRPVMTTSTTRPSPGSGSRSTRPVSSSRADQLGHGRLGDALAGGERGQPPGAAAVEGGQRGRGGQRQPAGRAEPAEQPDEPFQVGRHLGGQGLRLVLR